MNDVELNIDKAQRKVGKNVKNKLHNLLSWNNGYVTICKTRDVLSGDVAIEEAGWMFDCGDLTLFKCAPVTSYDLEQSFSC